MIVVATTVPPFVMTNPDSRAWSSWLRNAEQMRISTDDEIQFFASVEVDGRGIGHFMPFLDRLAQLEGDYWTWSLDDGETSVRQDNRDRRIVMGQNVAREYAVKQGASYLLFLGADTCVPANSINAMAALDNPIVAGNIPSYGLDGIPLSAWLHSCSNPLPRLAELVAAYGPNLTVQHFSSSFMLLQRAWFAHRPFHFDPDNDCTDDPTLFHDALKTGCPVITLRNLVGVHFPEILLGVEHRGMDMVRVA